MDLRISRNGNIDYDVMLPGSKSLSNRALLIMALCGNTGITGLAMCDDTDVMTRALGSDAREINVGAAGTAMRFLPWERRISAAAHYRHSAHTQALATSRRRKFAIHLGSYDDCAANRRTAD